jgi:hypothetical protein
LESFIDIVRPTTSNLPDETLIENMNYHLNKEELSRLYQSKIASVKGKNYNLLELVE